MVEMEALQLRETWWIHTQTIQATGGWQQRMKIGHSYNFLFNKNLFCTPLLVLSLRKFNLF